MKTEKEYHLTTVGGITRVLNADKSDVLAQYLDIDPRQLRRSLDRYLANGGLLSNYAF